MCFIFPLFNVFLVVRGDPEDNFYAISESSNSTQWILQGNETLEEEVFCDDISNESWDLYGASERYFDKSTIDSVNYLLDNTTISSAWSYSGTCFSVYNQDIDPSGITWDGTHFWMLGKYSQRVYQYTLAGVYTGIYFNIYYQEHYPSGICWDGTHFWVVGNETDRVYQYTLAGVYTGTNFYVGDHSVSSQGITWDGIYFYVLDEADDRVYRYTNVGVYTGTYFSVGAQETRSHEITWDGTHLWIVGYTTDKAYKYTTNGSYTGVYFSIIYNNGYQPAITWDGTHFWIVSCNDEWDEFCCKYEPLVSIFKNYFGSGYTYIQTNKLEEIGLVSSVYNSNCSLSSGDYFEVDFETNSNSEIKLELINGGLKVKELVLNSGQIFLDENVEFDQIRFTSLFTDQDYLKIFDIKGYNVTIVEHYVEFYVDSFQSHSIYLFPTIYNLKIFEDGEIKIDENIVVSEFEPFYYTYYSKPIQCQLFLSSTIGTHLDIENLHIKVNRSLYGVYSEFWLSDILFCADEGYNVTFTVYDQFDSYVNTFEKIATDIIDLEIEVYSLTIKNTMNEGISILINSTHSYLILPYEDIILFLKESYYQIEYLTNLGNGETLINLNRDYIYEINASIIPKSISIIYVNSDIGYNDIEWTSTGIIEHVLIELYNVSSFVEIISSKTENDGYYSWYINSNHIYNGDYYQIKVSNYHNNSIYDLSDYFTIECELKTITITNPTSIDTFGIPYYGDNYIEWTTTGSIDNVRIDLLREGIFLETIAGLINNDGSYLWYIDSDEYIDGNYYQIRVMDYDDNYIYGLSDFFTIKCESNDPVDPIDPINPNGIPSFDLLIIIGIIGCISAISAIVIRKRIKK